MLRDLEAFKYQKSYLIFSFINTNNQDCNVFELNSKEHLKYYFSLNKQIKCRTYFVCKQFLSEQELKSVSRV
jgi:hypothetical protein